MLSDYFLIALKNLQKRRLRSWLTIIGIVISIATIFTLISISLGLQGAITEQFRLIGTDKFFVMPLGQLGAPGTGGAVTLTIEDVKTIEKVQGVKETTYITVANAKIESNNQIRYYRVYGTPLDKLELFKETTSIKIDEGRFLKEGDKYKLMIGSDYKYRNLFKKPLQAGDKMLINGVEFKIEGILAPTGNPQDDNNIIMSIEDVREVGNVSEAVDQIIVQIKPGEDLKEVSQRTKRKLISARGVNERTKDFEIMTPEELLSSFGIVLNILTAFLIGIAAISLLVGAIGIANTMYTAVLERTREIGVMKAIGAQNKDVLSIFMIESGFLGMFGGLIGILLGVFSSKAIEFIASEQLGTNLLQAATPFYLIIGCLFFSFLTGALSGIWPAWQATKVKPVEALRYE